MRNSLGWQDIIDSRIGYARTSRWNQIMPVWCIICMFCFFFMINYEFLQVSGTGPCLLCPCETDLRKTYEIIYFSTICNYMTVIYKSLFKNILLTYHVYFSTLTKSIYFLLVQLLLVLIICWWSIYDGVCTFFLCPWYEFDKNMRELWSTAHTNEYVHIYA